MARGLLAVSIELHAVGADLLRLSAAARGLPRYQIRAEAAVKEHATAG